MLKGIKLDSKKTMSITDEIVDVSNPDKVYIPLINSNVICDNLTKKGRKVKKGTMIGIRKDIEFPILSPVSGKVLGVEDQLYLTNKRVPCIVIENDKKEMLLKKELVEDITSYKKEEFVNILKDCSIIGMGGSGFPTFLKYIGDINTLIVNAVECEPYITADLMLIKLKADLILETIEAIMKINNIEKCYIAYKKENKAIYNSFKKYVNNYQNIKLIGLKSIYPMGWERYIIKTILKKNYNKYPSEIGVVVNNVSTVFAIYKALKFKRAITKRIVTISGENFDEPLNVLAKVGTNVSEIINKIGKYIDLENSVIIAGGPMMGFSLDTDSLIVTNNLNAVLVLPKCDDKEQNCIECGKCINICPANLCPVFIMKNKGNKEKLKELHPEQCCECG
ncbi:MAG TPA: RnfABCDGE type electron transport complex subunit C, partial [Bacilli bacterium]|nr:RnfABCDGE type electron transport complex subunit C [Bacilli bacterium]